MKFRKGIFFIENEKNIHNYIKNQWIINTENKLFLTEKGKYFADRITAEMFYLIVKFPYFCEMAPNTYIKKQANPSPPKVKKKPFFSSLFSGATSTKRPLKSVIFSFLWKAATWFFGISIVLVFVLKYVPVLFTPTMVDRKLTALFAGEDSEIHYNWTPYSEISKEAALAVVAAEDQFFS